MFVAPVAYNPPMSRRIQLCIDPWPTEYDASVQIDALVESSAHKVDHRVETSQWQALTASVVGSRDLLFVDGSRRIEARLLADHDERIVHGLFGSLAVGAVRTGPGRARFEQIRVERWLLLGNGLAESQSIQVGGQRVDFEACPFIENSPLEAAAALQNRMREAEARLAESLAQRADCIFVDGPLTYFSAARHAALGVVKTLYQRYLDESQFRLVPQLQKGQRTPLFAILDGKADRYSWFLRIAAPRPLEHRLSGVLRLEVRQGLGLEAAQHLAELSAALLPRFASSSIREPRAPQNLLPIGALEDELRRRMGDPLCLRRAIERQLYRQARLHRHAA